MICILLILVISLFLICPSIYRIAYKLYVMHRVNKNVRGFASMPELPILGHFLEFSSPKKMLASSLKASQFYGGLVKGNLFSCFVAQLITDQKVLEFLLSTTNVLNKGMIYEFLERWLGTGLLTSEAAKWKKTRRIITPAFHFQILEDYADVFHSTSQILIEKLRKHAGRGAVDVFPYVTLCTLDTICETAMGTKVNAQLDSNSEYVKAICEMENIIVRRLTNPFKVFEEVYRFSKDYSKEISCLKILHGYTNAVIRQRREEIITKKDSDEQVREKRRKAFLDLILQATIDGRPLTDDEIRQEVDTFMFEGHDTTAAGISFILYCLSKYPDVQKKVHNELLELLGDDKTKPAIYKELQNMRYLEMVIKESLRLYPPVPIFSRSPDQDIKFYDCIFPRKTQLIINVRGVHADPKNYPNPHVFDPERFAPENQANRGPYSYLTFSAGHRNCIGQKFAMLEMKSTISHIVTNFEIFPVENYEPDLEMSIVLKSTNGVLVKLEERR